MVEMMALSATFHRLLHLYGGVSDAKVLVSNLLHAASQMFELSRIVRVNEYVGSEGLVSRGNSPGVNVVNHLHALHIFQRVAKPMHIQVGRHALQKNLNNPGHQTP